MDYDDTETPMDYDDTRSTNAPKNVYTRVHIPKRRRAVIYYNAMLKEYDVLLGSDSINRVQER